MSNIVLWLEQEAERQRVAGGGVTRIECLLEAADRIKELEAIEAAARDYWRKDSAEHWMRLDALQRS